MKNEQEYAKTTFDEIANNYDEIPFFKISARHVVELIGKEKGEGALDILDVACGTGNVVLECAACMTETSFDAVDISEGMLAKAKENASMLNIENVTFTLQDITTLDMGKKYDVITCSYALFFLPEAHKVLQKLASSLKDKGCVLFTSFLKEAFEPASEILLSLLKKYGSSTAKAYDKEKWENLKQIQDIEHLCKLAEVNISKIESKPIRYGMDVDAWWRLFNNTGYKGMLMELSEEDYIRTKEEFYESMFNYADMDGEIELNADTYFVIVSAA